MISTVSDKVEEMLINMNAVNIQKASKIELINNYIELITNYADEIEKHILSIKLKMEVIGKEQTESKHEKKGGETNK
jgi:L-2-hydroxyglutarate oxidase LhgO